MGLFGDATTDNMVTTDVSNDCKSSTSTEGSTQAKTNLSAFNDTNITVTTFLPKNGCPVGWSQPATSTIKDMANVTQSVHQMAIAQMEAVVDQKCSASTVNTMTQEATSEAKGFSLGDSTANNTITNKVSQGIAMVTNTAQRVRSDVNLVASQKGDITLNLNMCVAYDVSNMKNITQNAVNTVSSKMQADVTTEGTSTNSLDVTQTAKAESVGPIAAVVDAVMNALTSGLLGVFVVVVIVVAMVGNTLIGAVFGGRGGSAAATELQKQLACSPFKKKRRRIWLLFLLAVLIASVVGCVTGDAYVPVVFSKGKAESTAQQTASYAFLVSSSLFISFLLSLISWRRHKGCVV